MPTGKVLKLKDVRIAFTDNLFVAGTYQNGPGVKKYGCKILIPKDHPQMGDLKNEIVRLATEEWKEKAQAVLQSLKGSQKFSFCDGDEKEWDGFAGNYYLNAKNKVRPTYVDRNPGTKENPNLITEASRLYSGCYVNAVISFWTWTKTGGNQMNCNLLGLQFSQDGEAFTGGGTASASEFSNEEPAEATVVSGDAASAFL